MTDITILLLATWRLAALLCFEDLCQGLREKCGVYVTDEWGMPLSLMGKILSCFWCTTLVTSVLSLLLFMTIGRIVVYVLALSGGAIILHHWTRIVRDVQHKDK